MSRALLRTVRFPRLSAPGVVLGVIIAVALTLRIYRLARPGQLFAATTYDDGVYFGDAVELVSGRLPYRDFVAVHPPMIMVLLAPIAALGKVIGTDTAFAVARVVTTLVSVAAVPITWWILRGQPLVVTAVGALVVACYPDAVRAGSMVELEPWLVLFCVIAVLLVFDEGRLRTGSPLMWGGVLLGVATAVKLWAVLPALVLAVLLVRRGRELARFVAATIGGFIVCALPFAIAAPHRLIEQVFVAQAGRQGPRIPFGVRMSHIAGLSSPGADTVARPPVAWLAVALFVYALALALVVLRWRTRTATALELFATGTFVLTLGAFLTAPQYYFHYGGFLVPWAALVIAFAAAPATAPEKTADVSPEQPPHTRRAGVARRTWAVGVAVLVVLAAAGLVDSLAREPDPVPVADAIEHAVPDGSCVLSNQVTALLIADRFPADDSACPALVDPYGVALVSTSDGSAQALSDPGLRRRWRAALQHAEYVVWTPYFQVWTPIRYLTRGYLRAEFRLVSPPGATVQIFKRVNGGPAQR